MSTVSMKKREDAAWIIQSVMSDICPNLMDWWMLDKETKTKYEACELAVSALRGELDDED